MIAAHRIAFVIRALTGRDVAVTVDHGPPLARTDDADTTHVRIRTPGGDEVTRALAALAVGMVLDDERWAHEAMGRMAPADRVAAGWVIPSLSLRVAADLTAAAVPRLSRALERATATSALGMDLASVPAGARGILAFLSGAPGDAPEPVRAAVARRRWTNAAVAAASVLAPMVPPQIHGGPVTLGLACGPGGTGDAPGASGEVARLEPPEPWALRARRELADASAAMLAESVPRWQRGVASPTLDIRAVTVPLVDPATCFRRLHQRATPPRPLEVAVDVSGSMRDAAAWAGQWAWAALGWRGPVRAHVFSRDGIVRWPVDGAASVPVPRVFGGTDLRRAVRELAAAADPRGIVAVVSDGADDPPEPCGRRIVTAGFTAPGLPRCDDPRRLLDHLT